MRNLNFQATGTILVCRICSSLFGIFTSICTSSNVFRVPGLDEAAKILDIYNLPQTEEFKDEDDLIQVAPGDRYVDLTKLIKDAILLDLPVKIVCTEDCQGLCAQCGTNLNKGECDCTDDSIDPRWAKLKEINFED